MLDQLKKLFGGVDSIEPKALAVAAILIEAARADDKYTDREKKLIDGTLVKEFGVAKGECARVRGAAERLQTDASDLYIFTKKLKGEPEPKRVAVIDALWSVVLSDSARGPYEGTLVRHVAGLLDVTDGDYELARQRAEKGMRG